MKRSCQARTGLFVGICALAFGIAISVVKGNNVGFRNVNKPVSALAAAFSS
ncbi:MAG TPA: hypothetical protein VMU68_03665 [Acidimicrobiales bacterium]|nr:hypothetical protein [Acidimicrobiales bacterium]